MCKEQKETPTWVIGIITGILLACLIVLTVICSGCSTMKTKALESASGKNLDMRGYLMLGEIANDANGRLVIGRLDYKSRKVSIPAETKTPNSGFFKATKTSSLFGSSEWIIEYDWTAGSDADAEKARQLCEELKRQAEEKMNPEEPIPAKAEE